MSDLRRVRILGTGKYLPRKTVLSTDLDLRLELPVGTLGQLTGVQKRRFAEIDETSSQMAAYACQAALADAELEYEDIDAIVSTSGGMEQPIPCNGALIQEKLGKQDSGTPCFDINSTCLSFVTGLDHLSFAITAGHYRRILLVSSEITSVGVNWKHLESAGLFGDGAAAVVLGKSSDQESSRILASGMKTFSRGAHYCEIVGGGNSLPGYQSTGNPQDTRFLFSMNGRKVFKESCEQLPPLIRSVIQPLGLQMSDFKLVIPHQASLSALELVRRRLEVPEERFMIIAPDYGNMEAASIPLALHLAIQEKRIQRGDKVLFLGTSAGLSFGVMALQY